MRGGLELPVPLAKRVVEHRNFGRESMNTKEKIREEVRHLNPIDDALFIKMAEDKPFC